MPNVPGLSRVAVQLATEVGGNAAGAVVRSEEKNALTIGAKRVGADLLESGGTKAGARAAATAPGSALRPSGQTYMNAEHARIAQQLKEAIAERAPHYPGTPEYVAVTLRIEAAQRSLNVFTTQQAVQAAEASLTQALAKGSESGTRTALVNVAKAQQAAGDALVTNGQTKEALNWYYNAGRTFERSGVTDLTEPGRRWASDLRSALNNFGRAGDVEAAVHALGSEGRVEAATCLVGRARNITDRTLRANTERVARGLIDDMRSRPFRMADGEVIAPRPPLTDAQWEKTLELLRSSGNPDTIRVAILRAP